jgi:hypothetical protein
MNRILRTLAFTLTGFLAMQSFAADAPKVLFEEKFTDRLEPGWKWIRERPDAWRLANGALIEDTLPGSYWEKQNSSQNTLVRPAPVSLKEGFIVEVFLESEPKGGYEHAGLLCYFDGENTLVLNKESIGGKGHVLMVADQDGAAAVGVAIHRIQNPLRHGDVDSFGVRPQRRRVDGNHGPCAAGVV